MRVIREEPQGDLKEGHEPTVNPTMLWDTPSQVFKHVDEARCVVLAQAPSSHAALYPFDLIRTIILNAWMGPKKTSAVLNLGAD